MAPKEHGCIGITYVRSKGKRGRGKGEGVNETNFPFALSPLPSAFLVDKLCRIQHAVHGVLMFLESGAVTRKHYVH